MKCFKIFLKTLLGFTILLLGIYNTYSKVVVAYNIRTYYNMYHVVMHMFVWIKRKEFKHTSMLVIVV